ncbi:hypothetical protein K440DRAFT_365900 [Wilcoxina mikolae CBS 423.85]|nr:hypothetical protein K440DRAFT_365900 [Wilcoxina mikolae CBS 423.85]
MCGCICALVAIRIWPLRVSFSSFLFTCSAVCLPTYLGRYVSNSSSFFGAPPSSSVPICLRPIPPLIGFLLIALPGVSNGTYRAITGCLGDDDRVRRRPERVWVLFFSLTNQN